jgi:eukaryotic-like serine/threonine-protein kinase
VTNYRRGARASIIQLRAQAPARGVSLQPGDRVGPYEILSPLGAGGMGEVFLANDTRLDRRVAVKTLRAGHSDRFEREARAISRLNHPHICALYDVGPDYLVMEYVEGETLAARLARGPLPLDKAIGAAIEIAGALDAAHRHGVLHRDLKPGNVMLTPTGAKLLDFGLAKLQASGAGAAMSQSTLTGAGTIVGTLHYIAPEQLEGKEVDARGDLFALGAVLYEMLTGRTAFSGASAAGVVSAILSANPAAPSADAVLNRVVERCLAKDPDDRWQTARDLKAELEWIAQGGGRAPSSESRRRLAWLPWTLAGIGAALAVAAMLTGDNREPPPATPVRFAIAPPAGVNWRWFDSLAVSPDGRFLVFTGSGPNDPPNQLWMRSIDAPAARRVPGASVLNFPFWSPDSRHVAFFQHNLQLARIPLEGGPVQRISPLEGIGLGGSWNRDDVLVFARQQAALMRVPAGGGEPRPLTRLEPGETVHAWPHFLQDGRHFLFFIRHADVARTGTYVGSLHAPEQRRLLTRSTGAAVAAGGRLFYLQEAMLMVRPFDERTMQLGGDPRPFGQPVHEFGVLGAAAMGFSVSATGVMAWRGPVGLQQLSWIDRNGRRLGTLGEAGNYAAPALSPDGQWVAVARRDPATSTRDVWLFGLARGTSTRLTFHAADDAFLAWSPDSRQVAFTSDRDGRPSLYVVDASSKSVETLVYRPQSPYDASRVEHWSPDGRYLLVSVSSADKSDLLVVDLIGKEKPIAFAATPQGEWDGRFSPDGTRIAYTSNESGRADVFVRPFRPGDSTPGERTQISTDGGAEAVWSRDGRELFYWKGNRMMAVAISGAPGRPLLGVPKALFEARHAPFGVNRFDVTANGERFLVLTDLEEPITTPIDVLTAWRP